MDREPVEVEVGAGGARDADRDDADAEVGRLLGHLSGSGRSVFSPSLRSTMTVDASLPGGTGAGADDGSGDRLL